MIPLYTDEEFLNSKKSDLLKLQCYTCNQIFYVKKWNIKSKKNIIISHNFCSNSCRQQSKLVQLICKQCNKEFLRHPSQLSKNNFCSKSCSVTHQNTHKTFGTRRSKLETWLEQKLTILYPTLEIHFNRKDTINSELDIYIPSLKLAFELNGIYHYEPIHGQDKLNKIINNDKNKFQVCNENQINLCIIDVSQHKYFKEKHNIKYLEIITKIINENILK